MTNICLHYLHRDEGNWKDFLNAVLSNPEDLPMDEIERNVRERLIHREYFYPERVGLPRSSYANEGDWHEFERLDPASDCAEPRMSLPEFLRKLEETHLQALRIHKIPNVIPLRLAVSWLEFLRETRQTLALIQAAVHRDSVVMVWQRDDWNLLEETLEVDAISSHFELSLRTDIRKALDRGREISDLLSKVKEVLQKCWRLESRIQRRAKRPDV